MFAAECGFVLDVLSFWVIAGQNPAAVLGQTGNEAGSGSVCPTLAFQIQQTLVFLFLQQHRLTGTVTCSYIIDKQSTHSLNLPTAPQMTNQSPCTR